MAHALDRFDAQALAYCQMGNHFHLVLHTRAANLSRLMRHLNGVYTQAFNRRHRLAGHLFQGRFKAILVDSDRCLLALCRYVERNPVAAALVARPADWAWSSCQAHLRQVPAPAWLDTLGLYGHLLGRPVADAADCALAAQRYAELVDVGNDDDASFWQRSLRGQMFLGDDGFARRMQAQLSLGQASGIPRVQRLLPATWPECLAACEGDRNRALCMADRQGGFTMPALASLTRLSVTHVARLIWRGRGEG